MYPEHILDREDIENHHEILLVIWIFDAMHKQVLALHQQKLEMASYNWHHWNWIIDAVTNQVLDGHY